MKRFLKRNYIIFILLILTIFTSLFNSSSALLNESATNLSGFFTIAFLLIWIVALFASMHKAHVMFFSIAFWSVFIITSVLNLLFSKTDLPIILSGFFTFALRIFYSSLYGITCWINNINISILNLIISFAFLILSIVLLRNGRCKLYEL